MSHNSVTTEGLELPEIASSPQRMAVFDLDGTLTTRDSFLAFLLSFGRRQGGYPALARTPFRLAAYLGKLTPDYRLKQDLIRDFLAKFDIEIVAEHSRWFCEHWLPKHLHPVGTQLLAAHRERGDRIVLLSASPNIVVEGIARAFGIEEVVCTQIESNAGHWTGQILGSNCKGPRKVEALQEYLDLQIAPKDSFAYGDSRSDRFVLEWVQQGAWVRKHLLEPLKRSDQTAFPDIQAIKFSLAEIGS